MKRIKILALIFGVVFCAGLVFYFSKQPSYSIKTEGVLYVVNKASRDITVFDLNKGKHIKEIPLELEPHEATVLPSLNKVIVTNYGAPNIEGKSVTVINANSNSVEKIIELGDSPRPHGIIAIPNTEKVAVVTDIGNDLSVVNVETGLVEKQIQTQQDFSHLLVRHPLKPLMYVANINSGTVSVVDVDLGQVVKIIPIGERAEGIDIAPDGSEIWVTNIKENYILVIDTKTYETKNRIDTGKEPLRLKFSNDGQYCLVSNSGDGTVSVYDGNTKKLISNIEIPGKDSLVDKVIFGTPRPVGILMHPNGLYAFVSNLTANRVEVIDTKSFEIVSSIEVGNMPDGIALMN